MIGFQDHVLNNNIKVIELAKEIGIKPATIWRWFNVNKIPEKYLDYLSEKFNLTKDYINKKINNINTYQPRKKNFNEYKIDGDVTTIFIKRKNKDIIEIKIDTEDLPILQSFNRPIQVMWNNSTKTYYARFYIYDGVENGKTKYKTIYIHRLLMNANKEDCVDHIDLNSLNNRKSNLRKTKDNLNLKHRLDANSNNKSGYRSVHWIEARQKYYVQLTINGVNTKLAEFEPYELKDAVKFANEMREKYYGKFKGKDDIINTNNL